MKVEGRCHCGQITYEAQVDPMLAAICHCKDCQMLTGSAFRATVPAPTESFSLITGQPHVYIKTADSGTKRLHAFCPNCGTPIYASAVHHPSSYSLRIGCLRQSAELKPQAQRWRQSALPWSTSLDSIPEQR